MNLLGEVRTVLGSVAGRALDFALPAQCAGCRREGPPLCSDCLPALDVRLHAVPGVPIGLPADIPPPLLQLEWCAPFTGVTRRAVHALKYEGERRLAPLLGAAVAGEAARRLRLPMLPTLERTRATTAQFDLDRAARAANLGGAFQARSGADVDGRWAVLVDDVMTTGATLAACAVALMEAGAIGVSAV